MRSNPQACCSFLIILDILQCALLSLFFLDIDPILTQCHSSNCKVQIRGNHPSALERPQTKFIIRICGTICHVLELQR